MYTDLITALREDAEWAEANIYEVPICLPDHLTAVAEALEAANVPAWIPTGEMLPEIGKRVLTCGPKKGVQICRYEGGGEFTTHKHTVATVTHWMPLPEAVKEKQK